MRLAASMADPNPSFYASAMDSAIGPVNMQMGMNMTAAINRGEPVKRKRGRPRKYGPDGSMALALAPHSAAAAGAASLSQKRGRGRPPGSGRKQQLAALGTRKLLSLNFVSFSSTSELPAWGMIHLLKSYSQFRDEPFASF